MSQARAASADDLGAICALLESAALPTSDLASARPQFVAIHEDGILVAAGAVQRFGASGLLRSVVVAHDHRGMGLGGAIVSELERLSREAGIVRLILLTQTAAGFFTRRGYQVVERDAAPADVQGSEEFCSLCPGSAVCMEKELA